MKLLGKHLKSFPFPQLSREVVLDKKQINRVVDPFPEDVVNQIYRMFSLADSDAKCTDLCMIQSSNTRGHKYTSTFINVASFGIIENIEQSVSAPTSSRSPLTAPST